MDKLEQIVNRYANEYLATRAELLEAPLELRMQQAYIMAARKKCQTEAVCQALLELNKQQGIAVSGTVVRKLSRKVNGLNMTASITRQYFSHLPVHGGGTSKEAESRVNELIQQVSSDYDNLLRQHNA